MPSWMDWTLLLKVFGASLLAVVVIALFLQRAVKSERRNIVISTGLFGLCVAGVILSGIVAEAGFRTPAGYLRWFSTLAAGMCLISLSGVFIFRLLIPALHLHAPRILQDVSVGIAYIVWALVWLRVNAVDLTSIIATSAVITAVIGLALQDTLGNIVGGLAIQMDQSFQVGDWLQIDDVIGRVTEIRWRRTSLETRDWETVMIPNAQLVKNRVKVLGRREGQPVLLRRRVSFNVDFRFSPSRVIEAVESALRAASIPRVSSEPAPQCILIDFADSYAKYQARYWLSDLAADELTDSDVRTHLYFALQRAGIPLSMPAQAVFVTAETAERKAAKASQDLTGRLEALRRIELFGRLQPEELQQLAARLVAAPFARDDVITRQGEAAECLFIICDGTVDVVVEREKGSSKRVAALGPGSFFGEMGLMTGAPRTASVVARSNVTCFRLDKASFEGILRSRPEAAEEISSVLARRRMELDEAIEGLDAEARTRRMQHTRGDLLLSIRRFFGLDD